MEILKVFIYVFVAGILTENFILSKFLGICPFLGVSKKISPAVWMSIAVTFVMTAATAITWPINMLVLRPLGIEYLQTVAFIVIIASMVQIIEIFMKKFMPPLYQTLGIYLPLITTNCAVLGVTTLVIDRMVGTYTIGYLESLVNSFSGGLGFLLAMVLFAGIRQKLETCDVPKVFRGLPVTLCAAAFLSMSFLGFGGIVDGLIP